MTLRQQLVHDLGALAAPLAMLGDPDDVLAVEQMVGRWADRTAAGLASDDDRELAQTVIDVMAALWPHGPPEQVGRAGWWSTPVGRVCATSLGRDDAEAVTQSVAAAMLGVTRGTVAQLVHRGRLDRHPDGHVLRASVLQRIADRS